MSTTHDDRDQAHRRRAHRDDRTEDARGLDPRDGGDLARSVLAGLTPTRPPANDPRSARERARVSKGLLATVPIVIASSVAMMNLTGPVEPVEGATPDREREGRSSLGSSIREAFAAASAAARSTTSPAAYRPAAVPSTYRVAAGDTVSSIAGRFGLSTASVLALNGLGWKSVIFPGQVLKLGSATSTSPAPQASTAPAPGRYTIAAGDTISRIASRFGVSVQSILTANALSWSSIIYPGQSLTIPGASSAAPAAPGAAPAPGAAAPTGGSYTIQRGDTLSSISAKTGVPVQRILEANGLSWSSVIYAGRTLTIPSAAPATTTAAAPGAVTLLTAEMRQNAEVIVSVGEQLGVPEYGLVIALATAMQESSLRNIPYGDRDSVGLFQQRPSVGWGSRERLLDPAHAARLFYGGPGNPNRGVTRGLLEISGWQSMSLTQAAQAVQISAHPTAYAKWETSARAWLADLR